MRFDFSLEYTYIDSSWFDDKNSMFGKIGERAFYLYLNLFRFRLNKKDNDHLFLTSISYLRKETGYSSPEVLELLLKLKRYGVIKIHAYSRTEYFYDETGELKDKETLLITCTTGYGEWEHNIPIDLHMVQHYIDSGLKERYLALYCLLRKLSNGTVDAKAYMKIENMAKILKCNKSTVNEMIHELNRRYLVYSWKVKVKKADGTNSKHERFEHKLCYDYGILDQFKNEFSGYIDANLKKWGKI